MTDAMQVHRECTPAEHAPWKGRSHGHCIICDVPFPCPAALGPIAEYLEAVQTIQVLVAALASWQDYTLTLQQRQNLCMTALAQGRAFIFSETPALTKNDDQSRSGQPQPAVEPLTHASVTETASHNDICMKEIEVRSGKGGYPCPQLKGHTGPCGIPEPGWWLQCRNEGHDVTIDDLSHRGSLYAGTDEYFCSTCSRGETRAGSVSVSPSAERADPTRRSAAQEPTSSRHETPSPARTQVHDPRRRDRAPALRRAGQLPLA